MYKLKGLVIGSLRFGKRDLVHFATTTRFTKTKHAVIIMLNFVGLEDILQSFETWMPKSLVPYIKSGIRRRFYMSTCQNISLFTTG